MSAAATSLRPARLAIRIAIALGLLVVAAANWHLVHVAMTSQPDCVAHVRIGEGDGRRGLYSAAQSSCEDLGRDRPPGTEIKP